MHKGPTNPSREIETAPPRPRVGVIYNPRSHRNKGQDLLLEDCGGVQIEVPQSRADIETALRRMADAGVDYLVINGGDGTVRDVLSCGMQVFGANWPALAVLPKGKTNALNVDLGAPSGWSVREAVDSYATGRRIVRCPMVVRSLDREEPDRIGFIMGAGGFTLGVQAGQDAHRMGAFNSLAVGVTALWGVAQALFGGDRNQWRRGATMEILLGPDRTPLHHAGEGFEGRRSVMLASTLQSFPVGLKLFGRHLDGIKLCAMDRPRRSLLAQLPFILFRPRSDDAQPRGLHQIAVDSFELTIEDDFILDGEAFRGGRFLIECGPELRFVVP